MLRCGGQGGFLWRGNNRIAKIQRTAIDKTNTTYLPSPRVHEGYIGRTRTFQGANNAIEETREQSMKVELAK